MGKTLGALLAMLLFAVAVVAAGCGETGSSSKPATYDISGRVTSSVDGSGISGVSLAFSGTTSTSETDASGNWSHAGLSGKVTVTPAKSGWVFTPPSVAVSDASASVDFTAREPSPAVMHIASLSVTEQVVTGGCGGLPGCTGPTYDYDSDVLLKNDGETAGNVQLEMYYGYPDTNEWWLLSRLNASLASGEAETLKPVAGEGSRIHYLRFIAYTSNTSGSWSKTDEKIWTNPAY